ncbi:anion transporter [Gimesia sp.]|uniref:anion transporter n=1 Tax=Gimesia sp. TaxID=2024833 RepID=UPI000C6B7DF5|nr:anion transporter [Gimesia sp.]MAX38969.1 anion transporter [Gimesia sp.]HAH43594.1 anion transporter [Planctomycetaceae bacterium]
MNALIIAIYVCVYLSMLLGGIPGLKVDRTGAALLGALILLAAKGLTEQEALESIDVPTLALLFGMMVISAQLRLGGFYGHITNRIVMHDLSPPLLLASVTGFAGALSAFLTNDVVCLAVTPILSQLCLRKKLNPIPFLIALACAANIGSAATLIGNPQNILIGESLNLSFNGYLLTAFPPCLLGLIILWAVIVYQYQGQWYIESAAVSEEVENPFNSWQTGKGLVVLILLVLGFMLAPWPRELLALGAAGILLFSRTFYSRNVMGLVDWPLLVLFISLFIVNQAFQLAGGMEWMMARSHAAGISLENPATLFLSTAILSNLVSNVPAIMLLLPLSPGAEMGPVLALSSTLAGNFIIVGSVANIIVVESARLAGIKIDFKTHARVGVPVTIITLAVAWIWLRMIG